MQKKKISMIKSVVIKSKKVTIIEDLKIKIVLVIFYLKILIMISMNSNHTLPLFPVLLTNIYVRRKAQKQFNKAHIARVKEQVCKASMTADYASILYGLDRIVDNCVAIAEEAAD